MCVPTLLASSMKRDSKRECAVYTEVKRSRLLKVKAPPAYLSLSQQLHSLELTGSL